MYGPKDWEEPFTSDGPRQFFDASRTKKLK